MSPEPSPPLSQGEPPWHEMECQVESLVALTQRRIEPGDFYAALLECAARLLDARAGVVWRITATERQPIARHTGSTTAVTDRPCAPSQRTIMSQLDAGAGHTYCIEVEIPADLALGGATDVLNVLRDVALQYHHQREVAALRAEQELRHGLEELLLRIHACLDPAATAYALANDGRAWLACDRFSVIEIRGRRAKVLAISGVDEIDPRSEQVRRLERLAPAIAHLGEPFTWSAGAPEEIAPEISALLEAYVDRSHAMAISLTPLRRPAGEGPESSRSVIGLLVAERFVAAAPSAVLPERLQTLAPHAACALATAFLHRQVPLLGWQLTVGGWLAVARRRPFSVILLVAGMAAALAALIAIPADFTVDGAGTLQPQLRRHLFAPLDGVVEEVLVEHGQQVAANDLLLRLRNPELALELTRVTGELLTAQARWATVRAQRASPHLEPNALADERQLAAEEEQLREQIAGLAAQQEVLRRSLADLEMTSPFAGVVLTWNLTDRLLKRPVKRGQQLLTVADPDSPWTVELQVPVRDAGHILAARAEEPDVQVALLFGSDASVTHRATMVSMTQAAESTAGEPPHVIVTARLHDPPGVDALAGASVAGRIHCGRRPLGYVWLHDLIDAARRKLWY